LFSEGFAWGSTFAQGFGGQVFWGFALVFVGLVLGVGLSWSAAYRSVGG